MSSETENSYTEKAKKGLASTTLQANLTNLQNRFGKGAMKLWSEMEDPQIRDRVKANRMKTFDYLDIILAELAKNVRKNGGHVYFAATAQDAIDYTREVAKKIKEAGFAYVGVSLDGTEEVHDSFRGAKGAFEKSLQGLRNLMEAGVRTGVRFAITNQNYNEFSKVLEITRREKIPRFSLFQLVYGGRGKEIIDWDIFNDQRREVMDYIIKEAKVSNGMNIVTADNYADGIYLLQDVAEHEPERAAAVEQLLAMQSGCPAGDGLANVDNKGDVHLCPYWQSRTIGNIREKKFSDIWFDEDIEILAKMRDKTRYLKDKCGRCKLSHLCMGCRVRAEVACGDPFGEDPACYLTEEEISGAKVWLGSEKK